MGVAAGVRRVVEAAARHDGRAPLDEATLLSLRHRGLDDSSLWVFSKGADVVGFALAAERGEGPVEVSLVVDPGARGQGVASALAAAVLAAYSGAEMSAWSHGNHPAAARLAASLGFDRVRDLWLMRRSLREELPPVRDVEGVDVRPFRPGLDEQALLAVNAAAFAHHPEQGGMTEQDLQQRLAEPWFDPAGFFLAFKGDDLVGFHWTKVHQEESPPFGEVYVVGVAPQAQGSGLGKVLTLTGLHHLRSRGLGEVVLYVEADNAPAVAVYEGLGFSHAGADTDVMYARHR
jgi:mycothiol synthase